MTHSALMFLRPHQRTKDGKDHIYWSLVETVRTVDGPRQRTLCHLGELNDSAQARWLKTNDVFNDAGERHQLKLFPSDIAPPPDDAEVAQVLVQRVRLERTRQLGPALLGVALWRQLRLDEFFETRVDAVPPTYRGRASPRSSRSIGSARPEASWPLKSAGIPRRRSTIC